MMMMMMRGMIKRVFGCHRSHAKQKTIISAKRLLLGHRRQRAADSSSRQRAIDHAVLRAGRSTGAFRLGSGKPHCPGL